MPCIVQVKGLIACVLFARLRLPSQAKKKSVLYVLLDLPACTEIAITDLLLVFGIALPTLDRRVIQFGARESVGAAVKSSCYKHLAISQQRGRMVRTGDGEIAGLRPCTTRRIITPPHARRAGGSRMDSVPHLIRSRSVSQPVPGRGQDDLHHAV